MELETLTAVKSHAVDMWAHLLRSGPPKMTRRSLIVALSLSTGQSRRILVIAGRGSTNYSSDLVCLQVMLEEM